MEPDFSGYATKADLKCSDGRVITAEAFKHMDGHKVPLVWQHSHNEPAKVLGHAILEARPDGMYARGYFNNTEAGINAKALVQHKDIDSMSIWANQLVEKVIGKTKQVLHGAIKEVSLVLAGANPGAKIDFIRLQHGDGFEDSILEDEAIITTGLTLEHVDQNVFDKAEDDKNLQHETMQDVFNSLNEKQLDLFQYALEKALNTPAPEKSDSAEHSSDDEGDLKTNDDKNEGDLEHKEGADIVGRNVFDQDKQETGSSGAILTHDDIPGIFENAKRVGFKAALRHFAEEKGILKHDGTLDTSGQLSHGITNIEMLFPEARSLKDRPDFFTRNVAWVESVLADTRKTPFSSVKHLWADLTFDEARAKGYVTGDFKEEEWFGIAQRSTSSTTIYKKQKLDRDHIIDITDFDVVAWLWGEMNMMIREELARAILIGDGRSGGATDKIKDPGGAVSEGAGIRSILNDHEMFAVTVYVNIDDSNSSYMEVLDALTLNRQYYKGTGTPTLYTTENHLAQMLLLRDETGSNRRLYNSVAELATALRVKDIVVVEPMQSSAYSDLVGIIVNLADYNLGTNKGGELTRFDDFDIDYNKFTYLIETRLSGALVTLKSAIIIKKTASANVLVAPSSPTFVSSTGVITIPTQTGVVYKDGSASGSTLSSGAQTALAAGASKTVVAVPASGYYFATTENDQWTFKRPSA